MEDKLQGLLGLARRAGKLTFGIDAVVRDAAAGKAALLMLSGDASPRTAEKLRQAAEQYHVRCVVLPLDKQTLGHAIGRGDTAVAAITDKSFAQGIQELCRTSKREEDC